MSKVVIFFTQHIGGQWKVLAANQTGQVVLATASDELFALALAEQLNNAFNTFQDELSFVAERMKDAKG